MNKLLLLGAIMVGSNIDAAAFKIFSLDFAHNGKIPKEFTAQGANKMPKLAWENPPKNTKSFALICQDPDAPGKTWIHWVVYNIPAQKMTLDHVKDRSGQIDNGTMQGINSDGQIGYDGPNPPPGKPHHYHFIVYALDTLLSLKPGATADQVRKAMQGHILAHTEIVGLYQTT